MDNELPQPAPAPIPAPAPQHGAEQVEPIDIEVAPAPNDAMLQRHTLGGIEGWLLRNFAPLVVICAALTVELVVTAILQTQPPLFPPADAPLNDPVAAMEQENMLNVAVRSPLVWIRILLVVGGLLGFFIALVSARFSPDAKLWLYSMVEGYVIRPLPALRMADVIAVVVVLISAPSVILGLLYVVRPPIPSGMGARIALSLCVSAVASSLAILVGIYLARRRAAGSHGSNGFWPFWTQARSAPQRSIWRDIGLGVITYPLTLWLVTVCIIVNNQIVKLLGEEPDQHPIISTLTKDQNPIVLAVIFLSATAGAAFFEEIIFRGMLYNVLRRYMRPLLAACLAAFLFAAVHNVWSQLLGLFMLGMILTWLYDRTGRLVASMTFHALNNFLALLTVLTL